MEENKGQTFRQKRETHIVPQHVKDKLKEYNSIKKRITEIMGEEEWNIPNLATKLELSTTETLYYVMSMLKFGQVVTTGVDDMDEYYFYKIKK